jgi:hypothetical protein
MHELSFFCLKIKEAKGTQAQFCGSNVGSTPQNIQLAVLENMGNHLSQLWPIHCFITTV